MAPQREIVIIAARLDTTLGSGIAAWTPKGKSGGRAYDNSRTQQLFDGGVPGVGVCGVVWDHSRLLEVLYLVGTIGPK